MGAIVMLMGALRMGHRKEGSLRCPGKESPSSFLGQVCGSNTSIVLSFLKTNS